MKVIKEILISVIGIGIITLAILFSMGFFNQQTPNKKQVNNQPKITQKAPKVKQEKVKITALGDSLTQGVGDHTKQHGYQLRLANEIHLKQGSKVKVYDEGVSGERSDQILKRLTTKKRIQNEIKQSDVLIVTAGGNDLFQNLQKDATETTSQAVVNVNKNSLKYQDNLEQIFKKARSLNPKIKIVMVGIYNPFFVYFPNVTMISDAVKTFNATAKATVDDLDQATFVNINQLSKGQYQSPKQIKKLKKQSTEDDIAVVKKSQLESKQVNSKEKNAYLSSDDHFHPNNSGYDMMTDKIYQGLKKDKVFK